MAVPRIRAYVEQALAAGMPIDGCHTEWPFLVWGPARRPQMRWNGQQAHVARFVLEQKLGRPLTASALHTCDNPACWNPAHLYEGTQADNVRDAMTRGRMTPPEPTRGLTAEDVRDLRAAYAAGRRQVDLARQYGLSTSSVWDIVNGRRYRSVS